MKIKIENQDKCIIKSFLSNSIPEEIKFVDEINGIDLMACYEELFNYSSGILSGHGIDINVNSLGTGKSFIFDGKYENILSETISTTEDKALKIHCLLSLATLLVLQKYAK